MENVSAGRIALAKPLQKTPHQQRLSSARLSCEQKQAAPRLNPEHHFRQSRLVGTPEEQKPHDRQRSKRILSKSKGLKKLLIWRGRNRIHKSTWGGLRAMQV